MDLIRLAIQRPMAVFAAVLMIVVLGLVSMKTIPIQLTPDIRRPILVITTHWSGVAPSEIEREITNRLEQELTGIEGLEVMSSRSDVGRSRIVMEFRVGQNMDRAFLLVSNRLNGISDLPAEAREPQIRTSSSDDIPIARIALIRTAGNTQGIETYGNYVEDVVVDRLQRVPGVSQVDQSGGSERELQIIIEPTSMARFGLTVPTILQSVRSANISISAGAIDEGKRRYIVRTDSETSSVERIRSVVLNTEFDPATQRLADVTIGDVAKVEFGFSEPSSRRRFNGQPMIRLNVIRDTGANVIDTMQGLRLAIDELNEGLLKTERLRLQKFYDETLYINSAIDLVRQNIFIGGALAALILLLFLRSLRATIIVGLAIPISVISTFVAMAIVGRSINVISLAGIAFAVGMVVDAAIVVLENIYRHRQEGKKSDLAAYDGARQVWSAVLASALTTVVVFIPILILNLTAGQLFRDIAVAISVSVLLSLLVSITVIPALSRKFFDVGALDREKRLRLPIIDYLAEKFVSLILGIIGWIIKSKVASIVVVVLVCGTAGVATYNFLPKLDYLPDGNRNFVIGRIQPPPGYNLSETFRVAEQIENQVKPLWASESGPKSEPGDPPKIDSFFFLSFRAFTLIGASSVDINRAGELVPILRDAIFSEPGNRGFVSQSSIFGRRIGGSRVINMDIAGTELEEILETARQADRLIRKALPRKEGTQVRPLPALQLAAPEVRVTPDLRRLANAGMTARDLGQTIDVLNEGMRVVEINVGSKRMDLRIKGPDAHVTTTQGIANLPVVTGRNTIVPVSSLANVELTTGPTQIRHLDRNRAVTLQIKPAKHLALETAIERIRSQVIVPLQNQGLPEGTTIRLSGAADDLTKTWNALKINLLVAVIIVYLVMAVLFESLRYPLIIMLSVPLATAGGVGGLAILNLYVTQPLDMLTMLGFVILIGIVVNNAILLVDQTLQHLRYDQISPQEAILAASRNRMRPIFMSTLTSVFGLIPLVIFPGAGSELYRGLGSVVVGGLTLSAVLTLSIIPPLLALFLSSEAESDYLLGKKQKADKTLPEPAE